MRNKTSSRVALCGILAALMVAIMTLGAVVPASSLSTPMLASLMLIPAVWELGASWGGLLYLAVAILSAILSPDKEAALFFVFLMGWYPVLRPRIQHIRRKPLRIILKVLIYNGAIAAIYAILLFVLVSPEAVAQVKEWTLLTGLPLLVLGTVSFLLYDFLLNLCTELYVTRLRRKLFPHNF